MCPAAPSNQRSRYEANGHMGLVRRILSDHCLLIQDMSFPSTTARVLLDCFGVCDRTRLRAVTDPALFQALHISTVLHQPQVSVLGSKTQTPMTSGQTQLSEILQLIIGYKARAGSTDEKAHFNSPLLNIHILTSKGKGSTRYMIQRWYLACNRKKCLCPKHY